MRNHVRSLSSLGPDEKNAALYHPCKFYLPVCQSISYKSRVPWAMYFSCDRGSESFREGRKHIAFYVLSIFVKTFTQMVKFVIIVVELAWMEIQRGRIVDKPHWIIQIAPNLDKVQVLSCRCMSALSVSTNHVVTRSEVDCSCLTTARIYLKPGYNVIKIFSIRLCLS